MVAVTVVRSTVLSPHTGIVELVVEVSTDISSQTLDWTTLDGGQGIVTLLSVNTYNSIGDEAPASGAATPVASVSGTVITFAASLSVVKVIVIRGR